MCVTWEGRAGRTYRHRLVSWTVNLDVIRSSPLLRSWSLLLLPRPLSDSEPDCCYPTSSSMKDSPSCPLLLLLLLCPPTPTVVDLMGSASRAGPWAEEGGLEVAPTPLADPFAPSLLDESGSGRASRVT